MKIPAASLIPTWTVATLHWCICLLHDCMWLFHSYILPFFNSSLCNCDLSQLLVFPPYDTFLISQNPLKIHDWINSFKKLFIYYQLMTASKVDNFFFFFFNKHFTYTLIFIISKTESQSFYEINPRIRIIAK